ncbi:MAG: hypothetical protein AVDCRST_MAG03-107, partial [uncultured Rubrobacteraceae bacterium]
LPDGRRGPRAGTRAGARPAARAADVPPTAARPSGPDGRLLGRANGPPGPGARLARRPRARGRARRDRGFRLAGPSQRRRGHRPAERPAERAGPGRRVRGRGRQREPGGWGRRRRREHTGADHPEHPEPRGDARAFRGRVGAGRRQRRTVRWGRRAHRRGCRADGPGTLRGGRQRRLPGRLELSLVELPAGVGLPRRVDKPVPHAGERGVYQWAERRGKRGHGHGLVQHRSPPHEPHRQAEPHGDARQRGWRVENRQLV